MQPNFTKRLQTEVGVYNFYFNRIYTVDGVRYHISTIDAHRKSFMFQMEEVGGNWILVNSNNCPDWIVHLEKKLEAEIIQHSKETNSE